MATSTTSGTTIGNRIIVVAIMLITSNVSIIVTALGCWMCVVGGCGLAIVFPRGWGDKHDDVGNGQLMVLVAIVMTSALIDMSIDTDSTGALFVTRNCLDFLIYTQLH